MKKNSKNSIENRGQKAVLRKMDGKEVAPSKYYGRRRGHGTYIAAVFKDSDKLVVDRSGKPIPHGKI